MSINQEKIGSVIGPGGKTIKSISEESKATINVEDDGTVFISSPNEESAKKAIRAIEGLTKEVEVGAIYTGKVMRIMNFGAFVEILPGKDGLVHIDDLAEHGESRVEDIVEVGDEIMVKVVEIDRMGRINLSRRAVFGEPPQTGKSHTGSSRRQPAYNNKQQGPPRTHRRPSSGDRPPRRFPRKDF